MLDLIANRVHRRQDRKVAFQVEMQKSQISDSEAVYTDVLLYEDFLIFSFAMCTLSLYNISYKFNK